MGYGIAVDSQVAYAKAQQRVEMLAQSYSAQTGKAMSEADLQRLFDKAFNAQLKLANGSSVKADMFNYATAISDGIISYGELAELPDSMLSKATKYIQAQAFAMENANQMAKLLLSGRQATQDEYTDLFKKLLEDNLKKLRTNEQLSIVRAETELDIKKYMDRTRTNIDTNG